ncbi:MAG: GNAT family N-acetyltransferase [Steroidobacteraceae bacterium]
MKLLAHTVEAATTDDIPALSALLSQLFSQEPEFVPDETAQRRGLASILADPRVGTILVAREGGILVGMVNLLYTVSTALGERVAWVEDLIVEPESRGRGLGALLLEAVAEVARDQGVRRLTLLTDGDNVDAQRFYARHGFTPSRMVPLRRRLQ